VKEDFGGGDVDVVAGGGSECWGGNWPSFRGVLVRLREAGVLRGLERGVVMRRDLVKCLERGALRHVSQRRR
jgi:hypothetical protein